VGRGARAPLRVRTDRCLRRSHVARKHHISLTTPRWISLPPPWETPVSAAGSFLSAPLPVLKLSLYSSTAILARTAVEYTSFQLYHHLFLDYLFQVFQSTKARSDHNYKIYTGLHERIAPPSTAQTRRRKETCYTPLKRAFY